MSSRRKKIAASGAVVSALVASHGQATQADFGSKTDYAPSGVYLTPDNEQWTVWAVALEPVTAWNMGWHVGNTYGNTDLDPVWTYPGGNDCLSQPVDLCIYDAVQPVEFTWAGRTNCVGTLVGSDPNAECSKVRIIINLREGGAFLGNSSYNVCHELGHSIGLKHPYVSLQNGGPVSCVREFGFPSGGNLSMTSISVQEQGEINAHYK